MTLAHLLPVTRDEEPASPQVGRPVLSAAGPD